jgi:hypothetical protein
LTYGHAKARGGEATDAQENGHGMRRNKKPEESSRKDGEDGEVGEQVKRAKNTHEVNRVPPQKRNDDLIC